MDYRERIESKVGILFQIADQYLAGQTPLAEAKELVSCEMANIRPAQLEAMKAELGERLKQVGNQAESEKLFELFRNYLSPPYNKLQIGHPLRNYYEENSRVRSILLKLDEMEDEEAEVADWRELYELLSSFSVHIKRVERNFYPRLIPMGMRLQVEKGKALGSGMLIEISKNLELLKNGDSIEFLFNQRSLSQSLMNYLDLEERVLYAKALTSFTAQDFVDLRGADDKEGYVFIEQPADFVPKEKPNTLTETFDSGLILSTLLEAKSLGIIYYTLSGEVVSVMGNRIAEQDLRIAEETRITLLDGKDKYINDLRKQGDQTFRITYNLVTNSQGINQGILKIIENISGMTDFNPEMLSPSKCFETIDSTQNIAELFRMYPKFQEDFFRLDDELKGLKGPFGMNFLKDSTVEMVAKSLRIDVVDLVDRINKQLKSY